MPLTTQNYGWLSTTLMEGQVIPAHPLALNPKRKLDEQRQRGLTRYYHASGAGGLAVAVHTTQFAIRRPRCGLFTPVLQLAAETVKTCDSNSGRRTVLISGICGRTKQAVKEAQIACSLGYHAGLVSLSAFPHANGLSLISHCTTISKIIPLVGFYLQPAAGGRLLSYSFWRRFLEIPNVVAIKVAPFNRYQTLDVLRAVAESGRENEVALYTGNDDQIVVDLLTQCEFTVGKGRVRVGMVGGLLGHWACWTRAAVQLLAQCKKWRRQARFSQQSLTRALEVTDCNAAFFDSANCFAGCIPGIHEVLRRQGLLKGIWCLDPNERLSAGQANEIDRIYRSYPHLNDDSFVREHLSEWING